MLPFLAVPMCIVNNENLEKEVLAQIQPSELAYHYPGFKWGVVCVMKSGSSFLVNLTPEQFDAYLEAYYKFVKSSPGKYGTVSLSQPKNKIYGGN